MFCVGMRMRQIAACSFICSDLKTRTEMNQKNRSALKLEGEKTWTPKDVAERIQEFYVQGVIDCYNRPFVDGKKF